MSDQPKLTEPLPSPAGAVPGGAGLSPRQRQTISRGVQYVIFVVLVALVVSLADWAAIREHFLDMKVAENLFPEIFTVALKNTVIYTISGYVLGFFLGLLVALMRLSSAAPNRWVALVYIEVFRGLPAVLVFILLGLAVPTAFPGIRFPFDEYGVVAIALGLVSAAYMAETIRAGLQAVPKGQMEAARSLGMSYSRAMITVVIPQALRIVIPPLTNELILLFKDSSLVFAIGVTSATSELTKFGQDIATEYADSTPLLLAGATYLLITIPLGIVVRRLEARQAKAR
ncbi:amino acid ABC transporter permease [Planobispora rosea]|uniref:Amino acid ABC transporter permease n=1 Tax=Planobispora rosea TaxID=35762 RepID=A0A8J3WB60_PLARO|nr:amino acid ABC transporter permease [Planobispora rosea]GGS53293.1 amino acid ABC transporter permease [Planobispora rosea]GIH82593.1 amino acid ABC transporter permease [Planobispora rosea]